MKLLSARRFGSVVEFTATFESNIRGLSRDFEKTHNEVPQIRGTWNECVDRCNNSCVDLRYKPRIEALQKRAMTEAEIKQVEAMLRLKYADQYRENSCPISRNL